MELLFRASKPDQNRVGATITMNIARSNNTEQRGRDDLGVVETLLDRFGSHPDLGERSPLVQTNCSGRWHG